MSTFNNGILDIPGLLPVNIGSSAAYPVSFAPQIRPPQSPIGQPQQASGPPPAVAGGTGVVSGFGGSGVDGTSPTLGGPTRDYGDAQFATMGMNGYMPGYSDYAHNIQPAQLSGFGSVGLGGSGQGLWDRIGSLGNAPTIRNDNLTQAGINAAGLFSPLVGPVAGIAQGFNLLDGGLPTGNALADMAFTPGASQSVFADAANWVNRQFGGEYMPYDLGWNTAKEPGIQAALSGLDSPYDMSQMATDFGTSQGGSDHTSGAAVDFSSLPLMPANDPYSMSGNMWTDFMQGATFGGGRFDGGGFGGGGMMSGGIGSSASYNGGWGE